MEQSESEDIGPQTEGVRPALLTAEEVGRLLNCSRRTVRRMADSGRIPAPVRLGRLVRWSRRGLLDWIAEGCPSCKRRR